MQYMRVVLEANPQVFVIENVDRFSRSSEFALLMDELAGGRLKRWKHHDWAVLNAADYGVPQRRQRTILMASRVVELVVEPEHPSLIPGGHCSHDHDQPLEPFFFHPDRPFRPATTDQASVNAGCDDYMGVIWSLEQRRLDRSDRPAQAGTRCSARWTQMSSRRGHRR